MQGEIDSRFIQPDYRSKGIARELLNHALEWFNANQVNDISIGVAYGNEETFKFYAKFGFLPKVTILQKKSDNN